MGPDVHATIRDSTVASHGGRKGMLSRTQAPFMEEGLGGIEHGVISSPGGEIEIAACRRRYSGPSVGWAVLPASPVSTRLLWASAQVSRQDCRLAGWIARPTELSQPYVIGRYQPVGAGLKRAAPERDHIDCC